MKHDLVPCHELEHRERERGICDTIFKEADMAKKLGVAPDFDVGSAMILLSLFV